MSSVHSGSTRRLTQSVRRLSDLSPLAAVLTGNTALSRRSVSLGTTSSLRFPWNRAQRRRGGGDAQRVHLLNPTVSIDTSHGTAERGKSSSDVGVNLPPLRCPGGPRLKSDALKQLFKVPHAGYLAKYDKRFVINLKLTHQIITKLARTAFRTPDKLLIELGPGAGSLTRSLLTRPCVGVLGIEMDERFNPHLEQIRILTNDKFKWINADVLKTNELSVIKSQFPEFYRQNLRRRPKEMEATADASAPSFRDEGLNTFRQTSAGFGREDNDWKKQGEEGADDREEERDGFSPLRSQVREALLRKRRSRRGFETGDDEGFQSRSSSTQWDSSERVSPNPALDVSDGWWANGDAKVEVIANLPFDIITELLMRYAVDCSRKEGLFAFGRVPLHIFTQKEVADRITAQPGSIHFSRLSVLCQAFFHVQPVRVFQEWTYYPRTEVLGALLTLQPRGVPLTGGEVLDGATLIHFTNRLMAPGRRGAAVQKALRCFMPDEVAQHTLQESRMDGATTVLHVTVEELVRMAGMWRRFLIASQQSPP